MNTQESTTNSGNPEEKASLWQTAHLLVLSVYRYTRRFPNEEETGLTKEFRTSATRIASHLAESEKCVNPGRTMQLLISSQSQLENCRYYLRLSEDLCYGSNNEIRHFIDYLAEELPKEIRKTRNNMSLGF